jgi:hypothetical protein
MLEKVFVVLTYLFVSVYREGELDSKIRTFEPILTFEPIPALEAIRAPKPIPAPTSISAPEAIPALEPVPESESIPAPEPLPASEANRSSQPTKCSEELLVLASTTTKKTEYALSWEFQWRRLSEHMENFWMILGPTTLSLVMILLCLTVYRQFIRVSYRQDDTTQEPSQPRVLLHQWESVWLESRATLERMQEFENLYAQFQNELDSLKMTVKAEGKMLIQLLSKLDSLKMTVKAQDEILLEVLSYSMRKIEVENEHDAQSHNDLYSVRLMEEEDERPAHFQDEGNSVRN